jgi:hypothetical protein
MVKNHQRIGSISNAHVGRDFEAVAYAYFQRSEGIALQRDFRIFLGAGSTAKVHRFDLGSDDPPVLIECKSLHWTETGRVPSAKIRSCNEAMYYFHLAPAQYRKVLFMLRAEHPRQSDTLAEYYARTSAHLIPPTVSIVEYDERLGTARSIKTAHEDVATFRQ